MTIFGNFSEVWNDNVLELKILMLNFENPQKVGQNNKDPPLAREPLTYNVC